MTAATEAGAKPLPRRIGAAHSEQARSRKRPAPVCGSAVLSTMPVQPATRAAWSTTFPVELATSGKARATTRWFLGNCLSPTTCLIKPARRGPGDALTR